MNETGYRQLLPIRAVNNSRRSLYAADSEESDEQYQPQTISMPLAWEKKQNSQPQELAPTAQTLPLVQTIKKYELIQEKLLSTNNPTPKAFDDPKIEDDIIVKPLNFREDTEPKHSAYGVRSTQEPTLMQPINEPRGLNFRYGEQRQQTGYVETRQQKDQSAPAPPNNRVLMSSQGARLGLRYNQSNQAAVKFPQYTSYAAQQPQPYVSNLTSEFLDRQSSKLVHHYDNLQRTFNNWQKMMSELPFRMHLNLSSKDIEMILTERLYQSLQLRTNTYETPSIDWDQERLKSYFLNYRLCSRSITLESIGKQNIGLKKYKNCVYFGGMNAGRKEGEGILVYYNGKRFEGVFVNDLKSRGVELDEAEIYYGEFINGVREGLGLFRKESTVAFGRFKDGEWSTDGVCVRDQLVYVNFENPNTKLIKFTAGELYLGQTLEYQKHGTGIEKFANGDVYLGNYDNGKPEGYGEYYWHNGAIYLGQFLSGLRHGHGRWYILNGDSYEGEYMNDKKCGQGQYRWHNGTYYKGSFENDYRHGYGEMFWADGRVYKGQWTNGIESMKRVQFEGENKKAPVIQQKTGLRKGRVTSSSVQKARLPLLRNSQNSRRPPTHPSRSGNKTIDIKASAQKSRSNFTTLNSTHHSIPRERLKALFNPNFNFDY